MESVLNAGVLRGEQQQECECCRPSARCAASWTAYRRVLRWRATADLIDACIYEMEALRARYRFLLRQAKQEGLTACANTPLWDNKA